MIALIKRVLGVKPDARETSLVWSERMKFAKGDETKTYNGTWHPIPDIMHALPVSRRIVVEGRVRRNGSVIRIK